MRPVQTSSSLVSVSGLISKTARMVSFLDSNLFRPFGLPEHAG